MKLKAISTILVSVLFCFNLTAGDGNIYVYYDEICLGVTAVLRYSPYVALKDGADEIVLRCTKYRQSGSYEYEKRYVSWDPKIGTQHVFFRERGPRAQALRRAVDIFWMTNKFDDQQLVIPADSLLGRIRALKEKNA